MGRSKLLGALDRHKGRDIKLEKQRKKEKEARKRKRTQVERNGVNAEEEEKTGGLTLNGGAGNEEKTINGALKKKGGKSSAVANGAGDDEQWETDEEEEELSGDDSDDMPDRPAFDMSRLEDSDSEGSSDDDAEEEEDERAEAEYIPLSDIESLASEDRPQDILSHQRLTINNVPALHAALNRIALPISKLPFSEHQSITTDEPVEIPDVEDDLNRELAFYSQSLSAVKDARALLKKEGVSFSRPADYFAEMVKDDEHMGKIKQKMIDEAAGKKAAADARRQRDLKKFGKQVQVAKLQERAKEKKDTLEKISILKRKRQGADLTGPNEDLFDVELDIAAKSMKGDRSRDDGKPNHKRQKKDAKYGFGGKKRHAKSGDAISSADMSGYSAKKMKGKAGGASKRLGKSRRAKRT